MSSTPENGDESLENLIRQHVRVVPDFPRKGILFQDITTLLKNQNAFQRVLEGFSQSMEDMHFDLIAAIEARGFIFGGALAHKLRVGLVPLRKARKLPWHTLQQEYELEYGTETLEIHVDGILEEQRVMVVDDLLATGGTMEAALKLIAHSGGRPVGARFLIELAELGGRQRLANVRTDTEINLSALYRIEEGGTI